MTEEEWRDADWRRSMPDYGNPDWPVPSEPITEQEWLESVDPHRMLEALAGRSEDRKLRLFACACCQNIWPLLKDERSRRAVQAAEHFADGQIMMADLLVAHGDATDALGMQIDKESDRHA